MYDIQFESGTNLIHIALRGFWSVETVSEYYDAKNIAIDKVIASGCSINNVRILFDIREWDTQSREVGEMILALDDRGVKGAVIAQKAMLPRKQSERLAGSNYQFFATQEAALTWLNSDHS